LAAVLLLCSLRDRLFRVGLRSTHANEEMQVVVTGGGAPKRIVQYFITVLTVDADPVQTGWPVHHVLDETMRVACVGYVFPRCVDAAEEARPE